MRRRLAFAWGNQELKSGFSPVEAARSSNRGYQPECDGLRIDRLITDIAEDPMSPEAALALVGLTAAAVLALRVVAGVIRDYGMSERAQAPKDSLDRHD